MAESSTFIGFTITGIGRNDEVIWKKHHATQGNDQKNEHIGMAVTTVRIILFSWSPLVDFNNYLRWMRGEGSKKDRI